MESSCDWKDDTPEARGQRRGKIKAIAVIPRGSYATGADITSIEWFQRGGEGGWTPWLRVLRGDTVLAEVAARHCVIEYAPPEEERNA